jgi:hypothetical protein
MNRALALLLVVPLVAGCEIHSKNPASGDAQVKIDADESGNVSFNLPFMNGNVKLPESAMRNAEFDIDGVKMIPGGTITGFNVDAADKGATVNIGFKAPASADEVRSYFLDQFKQKGVEAALAGDAISGKSKDGDAFVIRIAQVGQGSQGTIALQSKD